MNRRDFLGWLGVGAATTSVATGLAVYTDTSSASPSLSQLTVKNESDAVKMIEMKFTDNKIADRDPGYQRRYANTQRVQSVVLKPGEEFSVTLVS